MLETAPEGYMIIPGTEYTGAKFYDKISLETQQDGDNLNLIIDNPAAGIDDLNKTKYPDHDKRVWEMFSPNSDTAQKLGTAIDSSTNPDLAKAVKILVNAFPEIQYGGGRGALASKQVREAYNNLNEVKVPAAFQRETITDTIEPLPDKNGNPVYVGLGESLINVFGLRDNFIKPETFNKKRITRTLPVLGQTVVNAFKGRPNLGKSKATFNQETKQLPPMIEMFREDLSHDPEAVAKHFVAEQELDEDGSPNRIVGFSDDYSRIAPPEPSREGKALIDRLSDEQIKNTSIKEARHSFPTREDFEYFMFVKRALQAEKDDQL